MGVDIATWRMKIGTFSPRKPRLKWRVETLTVSLCVATVFVMAMLTITVWGDVETNPGPTGHASKRYTGNELSGIVKGLQGEIANLKKQVETLTDSLMRNTVCGNTTELVNKTDDLENRSLRENIVVYGIPVQSGESWDDCETAVRDVLVDKLNMGNANGDNHFGIERAHRVRKKKQEA